NDLDARVDIYTDPQLRYYSGISKAGVPNGVPHYIISGTIKDSSTWTGVGNTGNILKMKSNTKSSGKLEW
ncbi:MAG: Unknown protein, partial [uncultured Sulfurovum sp.]